MGLGESVGGAAAVAAGDRYPLLGTMLVPPWLGLDPLRQETPALGLGAAYRRRVEKCRLMANSVKIWSANTERHTPRSMRPGKEEPAPGGSAAPP